MQNTGNQYRLQKISVIQKQLEAEKEKRTQLGEKKRKRLKQWTQSISLFNCGTEHVGDWSFSYNYCCACSHYDRNDYDGCRNAVHTK